ncbi:MAG: flagellar basal body protein, partial [Rhodospirillales bacterium]|nr:flagellar basal body protein [Rhodospirillales bacterium]
MAGSLTLAIRTAQSGLLTNQAALNATANNIANVNSVGYSRKIVNMEQRVVESAGAGVQIADITRRIDE